MKISLFILDLFQNIRNVSPTPPAPRRETLEDYININTKIDKSELTNYVTKNYVYEPVPLCPNCKSRKPNKRTSKVPKYRCTKCRQEFDETIYKSIDELIANFFDNEESIEFRDKCFVTKDKWKNKHSLSNIKYLLQRELAKNKSSKTIEKEAFLLYLNDNIKYLSFDGTITACKKCASYFDLYKMELCPTCKEYYKGIQYPTCVLCLPKKNERVH